jgi:hypothetical protein
MDETPPLEGTASNWKKLFTTVTTFSKYFALALLVGLPFVGFYLGTIYGSEVLTAFISEETVNKEKFSSEPHFCREYCVVVYNGNSVYEEVVVSEEFDFNDTDYLFLPGVEWVQESEKTLDFSTARLVSELQWSPLKFSGKEYRFSDVTVDDSTFNGWFSSQFAGEAILREHQWIDSYHSILYGDSEVTFGRGEGVYEGSDVYFRIKDGVIQVYYFSWHVAYDFYPDVEGERSESIPGTGRAEFRMFISDPIPLSELITKE